MSFAEEINVRVVREQRNKCVRETTTLNGSILRKIRRVDLFTKNTYESSDTTMPGD